jgi:hypothetical protein
VTLIVYRDGALHADNLFVVEHKGYQQRLTTGPKLFMTPRRRAAIAVLGQTFSPKDFPLLIEYLEYAITHLERKSQGGKDLPEFMKADWIFNKEETSFLILTTRAIYHVKSFEDTSTLADDIHHCFGTGAGAFNVCMSAGLGMEEAYKAVNRVVWTAGLLAVTISRADLVEIPPWKKFTQEELDLREIQWEKEYQESGQACWVDEGGRVNVGY